MIALKQLIGSVLAITSVSGISVGVFFTAKHTISVPISFPPRKSVTAKSSNIKKTVAEANFSYYFVKATPVTAHTFEDLVDYKCSLKKENNANDLFDCVLLKLPTHTDDHYNKYLDNAATEFSSGEKILANTRYLLKILSTNSTTNNATFYLKTKNSSTAFATLNEEFSYSTSRKGIESNIVLGRATEIKKEIIPGNAKPKYICETKEKCVAYEIRGTPTEDRLISYGYSTIIPGFDLRLDKHALVKFSESKNIDFWKSKNIVALDCNSKKFIFTPLYLMVGTINTNGRSSNLFVVK